LSVLVLVVIVAVAMYAGVAALSAYWKVVPAYSASTQIASVQATITLRLFFTEEENVRQGRYYFDVTVPNGTVTIAMSALDWANISRTSIYLTPKHQIAIVGPRGDDHLISLDSLKAEDAREPSDDWTYLGAFDFQDSLYFERELAFVSAAQQAECIPMPGRQTEDFQVRKDARRVYCSRYFTDR
jgi:hypothetical protein